MLVVLRGWVGGGGGGGGGGVVDCVGVGGVGVVAVL